MSMNKEDFDSKLSAMSEEEAKHLLRRLYHNNELAKESIDFILFSDEQDSELLDKYKDKIEDALYGPTSPYEKDDLKLIQMILDEAKSATLNNTNLYGHILFNAVDQTLEYDMNNEQACASSGFDEDLKKLVKELVDIVSKNKDLYELWKFELAGMLMDFYTEMGSFEIPDFLREQFLSIPWVKDDDEMEDWRNYKGPF